MWVSVTYGDHKKYQRVKLVLQLGKENSREKSKFDSLLYLWYTEARNSNFQGEQAENWCWYCRGSASPIGAISVSYRYCCPPNCEQDSAVNHDVTPCLTSKTELIIDVNSWIYISMIATTSNDKCIVGNIEQLPFFFFHSSPTFSTGGEVACKFTAGYHQRAIKMFLATLLDSSHVHLCRVSELHQHI